MEPDEIDREVASDLVMLHTKFEPDTTDFGRAVDAVVEGIRRGRLTMMNEYEAKRHARMVEALKLAYRHVHLADEDVASGELGDELGSTLAECMGDEAFQAWVKAVDPWQDDDEDESA